MEPEAVPFVIHLTQASYLACRCAFHPVAEVAEPSVHGTARRRRRCRRDGRRDRRDAAASRDRWLQLDRRRDDRGDGHRHSVVASPADGRATADRLVACVRRPRRRAGRDSQIRAVVAGRRVDRVSYGGNCHRSHPRRADVHRQPDGGREAPGDRADAADHLPRSEHHQPVAAGNCRRIGDLPGGASRAVVAVCHHPGALAGVRGPADHADRRRRHADGHLAAQLVRRARRGRHGLRAGEQGAHHGGRARRIVRLHPLGHHVPRDEPLVHERAVRSVRPGPDRRSGGRSEGGEERHGA